MGSIQLGIQHTVGSLASKPKRDLLMMDFWEMETISFPPEGSSMTPAHHYSEFRFKIYAPIAFRYFRDLFGIQPDDFMVIFICSLFDFLNIYFLVYCDAVVIIFIHIFIINPLSHFYTNNINNNNNKPNHRCLCVQHH